VQPCISPPQNFHSKPFPFDGVEQKKNSNTITSTIYPLNDRFLPQFMWTNQHLNDYFLPQFILWVIASFHNLCGRINISMTTSFHNLCGRINIWMTTSFHNLFFEWRLPFTLYAIHTQFMWMNLYLICREEIHISIMTHIKIPNTSNWCLTA
jgi:hypothetical protein